MGKKRQGGRPEERTLMEDFSLERLRLFVEIIRCLDTPSANAPSQAAVAKAIGTSDTTVSNLLRDMKRHYGRALVDDETLTPTVDGRMVMGWAERVLDEFATGFQLPVGGREQIVLGATGMVDTFVLPGLIERFLRESKAQVDFRVRVLEIEDLLRDLTRGLLHAAVCGRPESGSRTHLVAEDLVADIPTVMIAANVCKTWGQENRWLDRLGVGVRLAELRREVVCVLDADLRGVLAELPTPVGGGSRICVDRYATLVSVVQTGAAVGFVPLVDKARIRSKSYPGFEGLVQYQIAETERMHPRTVCLWQRRKCQLSDVVAAFLEFAVRKYRE